jgi:hypothetical protein
MDDDKGTTGNDDGNGYDDDSFVGELDTHEPVHCAAEHLPSSPISSTNT